MRRGCNGGWLAPTLPLGSRKRPKQGYEDLTPGRGEVRRRGRWRYDRGPQRIQVAAENLVLQPLWERSDPGWVLHPAVSLMLGPLHINGGTSARMHYIDGTLERKKSHLQVLRLRNGEEKTEAKVYK